MTSNIEPAGSAAVSSPETNGAGAPSCYRVSVISGSLEVSARLKNADDLELLLKVLEANKGLFPKVERSAIETVVKATKPSGPIRDRRICEGGPRDQDFGESWID